VVNMSRQIARCWASALLVAILGTTDHLTRNHPAAFTTAPLVHRGTAAGAGRLWPAIGNVRRRIAVTARKSGSLEPVA